MSRDKPVTSDVTDADINKHQVLRQQSRKIIHNIYTFLKKLSSEDEHAKTNFSKTQQLTVQACGTGSVHKVSRICSKAKISVRQKKVY
jgi:hypothetical protein